MVINKAKSINLKLSNIYHNRALIIEAFIFGEEIVEIRKKSRATMIIKKETHPEYVFAFGLFDYEFRGVEK